MDYVFPTSHTTLIVWDFPAGPVVKTPCLHCRGQGSIPGRGAKIPHAAECDQKIKTKNEETKKTLIGYNGADFLI